VLPRCTPVSKIPSFFLKLLYHKHESMMKSVFASGSAALLPLLALLLQSATSTPLVPIGGGPGPVVHSCNVSFARLSKQD
jgi:hypothetical protein